MKWRGRSGSSNVEDRRGMSAGRVVTGGGLIGLAIYLLSVLLSGDPSQVELPLQHDKYIDAQQDQEDTLADFVSVVLAETETAWTEIFERNNMEYVRPRLVLFRDHVESGCGMAGSATGPFYCPADYRLYIDLSFYQVLRDRFGADGDFAMAYVIAHEVGHHVQNLLGTTDKVQGLRHRLSEKQYNEYSVRLELQADYYAGVWAHYADKRSGILEAGDMEEALRAASAVGDDNIQNMTRGHVVPDAFTHGTSAQRMNWFSAGYRYGDLSHGNTFEGNI